MTDMAYCTKEARRVRVGPAAMHETSGEHSHAASCELIRALTDALL